MKNLIKKIKELDGKKTSCYTTLCGNYMFDGNKFLINEISGREIKYANTIIEIPIQHLLHHHSLELLKHEIPLCNYILREFFVYVHLINNIENEGKISKGYFISPKTSQNVLINSAVKIKNNSVLLALDIKLPYSTPMSQGGGKKTTHTELIESINRRTKGIISARSVNILLVKKIHRLISEFISNFNIDGAYNAVELYVDQMYIREYLKQHGYVSFINNGAILPRKSNTDYKDKKNAVPFNSPPELNITIQLPSEKTIEGMGIKRGITVITGDAYNGKSTILDAIYNGIYNHIESDGREYVITNDTALMIKAEEGRSVIKTDISFFLKRHPIEKVNSRSFSSINASGSTSQAAAVAEAVEFCCELMLFDEDKSANNFMYKDEKLKIITKNSSTCPFIDNAYMLYNNYNISSIIVGGSSCDYFKIANQVILVENYQVSLLQHSLKKQFNKDFCYVPDKRIIDTNSLRELCLRHDISIYDDGVIKIGGEKYCLPDIIKNITTAQMNFIVLILYYITYNRTQNISSISEIVESIYNEINNSMDVLYNTVAVKGPVEYVRKIDVMNFICRLRCITFL